MKRKARKKKLKHQTKAKKNRRKKMKKNLSPAVMYIIEKRVMQRGCSVEVIFKNLI